MKYEEVPINILEEYRLNGRLKDKYILNSKGKIIVGGIYLCFILLAILSVI